MPKTKKKSGIDGEEEDWAKSEAKKLLAKDIIDGVVTDDMDWGDVFWQRPEYAATTHRLFRGRLESLRKQISFASRRAAADEAALAHDCRLFPAQAQNYRGEPRWDGSAAQSWLTIDVKAGKHEQLEPKQLHQMRLAYKEFPLDVFREHIYQEVRKQKYCTWRNETNQRRATDWA